MKTVPDLSGVQRLAAYLGWYRTAFADGCVLPQIFELQDRIVEMQVRVGRVTFSGNSGSVAIASHYAMDFSETT